MAKFKVGDRVSLSGYNVLTDTFDIPLKGAVSKVCPKGWEKRYVVLVDDTLGYHTPEVARSAKGLTLLAPEPIPNADIIREFAKIQREHADKLTAFVDTYLHHEAP